MATEMSRRTDKRTSEAEAVEAKRTRNTDRAAQGRQGGQQGTGVHAAVPVEPLGVPREVNRAARECELAAKCRHDAVREREHEAEGRGVRRDVVPAELSSTCQRAVEREARAKVEEMCAHQKNVLEFAQTFDGWLKDEYEPLSEYNYIRAKLTALAIGKLCRVMWPCHVRCTDTSFACRIAVDKEGMVNVFVPVFYNAMVEALNVSPLRRRFMYGVEGVGKSHLLLLRAIELMHEHALDPNKPNVLYLPSASTLMNFSNLLSACVACFRDSSQHLRELAAVSAGGDPAALLRVIRTAGERSQLIVIVDMAHQLEGHDSSPAYSFLFTPSFPILLASTPHWNQQDAVKIVLLHPSTVLKLLVPPFTRAGVEGCFHHDLVAIHGAVATRHGKLKDRAWDAIVSVTGAVPLRCAALLRSWRAATQAGVSRMEAFRTGLATFVDARASALSGVLGVHPRLAGDGSPPAPSIDLLARLGHTAPCDGDGPGICLDLCRPDMFPWDDVRVVKGSVPLGFPACDLVREQYQAHWAALTGAPNDEACKAQHAHLRLRALELLEAGKLAAALSFVQDVVLLALRRPATLHCPLDWAALAVGAGPADGRTPAPPINISVRQLSDASQPVHALNSCDPAGWYLFVPQSHTFQLVTAVLVRLHKPAEGPMRAVVWGVCVTLQTPTKHAHSLRFVGSRIAASVVRCSAGLTLESCGVLWIASSTVRVPSDVQQECCEVMRFLE